MMINILLLGITSNIKEVKISQNIIVCYLKNSFFSNDQLISNRFTFLFHYFSAVRICIKTNGDEWMAPECFIFMERLYAVYSPFNIPSQRNVQSMTSSVDRNEVGSSATINKPNNLEKSQRINAYTKLHESSCEIYSIFFVEISLSLLNKIRKYLFVDEIKIQRPFS